MKHAAIYLRSSKDRADMSLAAQRRELRALAKSRGWRIVDEYTDAVESAKTDNRPGFQRLVHSLKNPARGWSVLAMVDTSRLSRRRFLAQAFKHQARRHGVEIVFSKLPDMDPITGVIVESVLEAMDEVHSLMSREKGLAGMAENVRAGWRAGGRAPYGYRLERVATGAIREDAPVKKSRLAPSDDADAVRRYLVGRASGLSRRAAAAASGLPLSDNTLHHMERNALTYAGATVWNMRRPKGTRGQGKYRPRSEWVIQRDTHPGLITSVQADAILAALDTRANGRRTPAAYLLTGLLQTPDGAPWYGHGGNRYRCRGADGKSRTIAADRVDGAVVGRICDDLAEPTMVDRLAAELRKAYTVAPVDGTKGLRAALDGIDTRVARHLELAEQMANPAPVLRKLESLEADRDRLHGQIDAAERELATARAAAAITASDVRRALDMIRADFSTADREVLKDRLHGLLDRVELDPVTLNCRIRYRVTWDSVASPGGSPAIPQVTLVSSLRVA